MTTPPNDGGIHAFVANLAIEKSQWTPAPRDWCVIYSFKTGAILGYTFRNKGIYMRFLRTAVPAVLFCGLLSAQDYRATILGQVTDPSGSAIPNASVKATRIDTNQTTEVKTNANGI